MCDHAQAIPCIFVLEIDGIFDLEIPLMILVCLNIFTKINNDDWKSYFSVKNVQKRFRDV